MSPFQMIPAQIDVLTIVSELRAQGWTDYKLEIATGLKRGYIAQCRIGNIRQPAYDKAARLYNFWIQQTLTPSTVQRPAMYQSPEPIRSTQRST